MRKERSLRQMLTPLLFLAAGVPIILFTVISLFRLSSNLNESLERRIQSDLDKSNQSLNMVLDKYDTILYDFCTDDEMIRIIEDINSKQDTMDVNSSIIRRQLSHICNRNDGIEGITIQTAGGETLFYDRLAASSNSTEWADKVDVPDVTGTAVYRGVTKPITSEKEKKYMIQISRDIVDYQDIHKKIGTVVLSIDENILTEALKLGGHSKAYLYQGGIVISAPDNSDIGKSQKNLEKSLDNGRKCRFTYTDNEKTNFLVGNMYMLDSYKKTMIDQAIMWLLITLAAVFAMTMLVHFITRPYMKEIDTMVKAMSEVENGNFHVEMPVNERMPVEMRKISSGFNEMVKHIDGLIYQVREAVVEQKNAELAVLEAQIDPHFLYNTLDTINWKAIERGEFEISEMVGALADILRYAVKNSSEEATIEQGLYWMDKYAVLQRVKLGKDLIVSVNVPEELKGYRIHKLLIQPFVENAIKHAFGQNQGECRLSLSMHKAGDQLHIIIEDNGKGIEEETLIMLNDKSLVEDKEFADKHLGIVNVRKRLELYYEDQADIYFESKTGEYTKVHLFIPAVNANKQS